MADFRLPMERAEEGLGDRVGDYLKGLFDLTGRVALVTGGNQGIGLGIARALAGAGAHVVVANRRLAEGEKATSSIREAGGLAMPVALDVTSEESISATIEKVVKDLGRLDILVNNAGILIRKPAEELSEAEIDAMLTVNVRGAYRTAQAAFGPLRASGRGRIINTSSVGAERALPNLAAYAATKAALSQLTRAFAYEWARHRITVNAMAPGFVRTPINAAFLDANPARARAFTEAIPQGRMGTPEDVGALALFLASPAADHITGQTIFVDGGRTAY
jgi:NAD(P)-dependent dehydrogenase (short-subunit alcohol dehydrogenase family)